MNQQHKVLIKTSIEYRKLFRQKTDLENKENLSEDEKIILENIVKIIEDMQNEIKLSDEN